MDEAKGVKGRIRDANRTREAILAAAAAIFAAQGFAGVRLDAIAEDSGYNKSLIGQYFGDRLGLYSEMIVRGDREVGALLALVLQAPARGRGRHFRRWQVPIVFHNLANSLPVGDWQVVQEVDGLKLLLSAARGALDKEAIADAIRRELARQGAVVPRVEVKEVVSIPQAASGKTPLVKSNLPGA